jgi:hypothetical protein
MPCWAPCLDFNINLRMVYLVPGQGEVTSLQPDLDSLLGFVQLPDSELLSAASPTAAPLKPLSLDSFPRPILCLAPKSDKEAARAIDAAKLDGFQQVWIRLPADGSTAPLVAAISQAKKQGLSVSAVVSLFRQPSSAPDTDQNVQGQTSSAYDADLLRSAFGRLGQNLPFDASPDNWRQPSTACLDDQKKRLTTLASLPGLTGIVLRDTAAPGYETLLVPPGEGAFPINPLSGTASRDMDTRKGCVLRS